ncbi:TPA: peptidase [Bacillus cereus]|nr:peptidase [Bacillus cereus]
MSLEKIKGSYDAIFSLGHLCLASQQLEKNQLRPFSGVLDWMGSPSLPAVSRLLKNRFSNFMDLSHLIIRGYATEHNLLVEETVYQIFSNHDFATDKNTLTHLTEYNDVKAKFDRRIQRFLEKIDSSQRILFVRTESTFTEILELEAVLSTLVKHDFRILVVNHSPVQNMIEIEWPLEKVSVVQLPDHEIWLANDHYWRTIFKDIHLQN